MLRTLWLALVTFVMTMACGPSVIVLSIFAKSRPEWIEKAIRLWGRSLVWGAGIELSDVGMEKLDPKRRYILVSNHSSYLDIPVLIAAVNQPLRFMGKASLFLIPVFGWSIKAAGVIPVDRKRTGKGKASFDLAAKRLKEGNTVLIFPEGGRSYSGEMKPFKHGPFLLAMKSGMPIVPVSIRGNSEVLPAGRFRVRPGPVQVRIGDPIEVGDVSIKQKDELIGRARKAIEEMLV